MSKRYWKVAPGQIGLGGKVCSINDEESAASQDAEAIDREGKTRYVKVRYLKIVESNDRNFSSSEENYYWCVVVPK